MSSIWSWGYNNRGQLGLGDTTDRHSPVQIGSLRDWNSIGAGNYGDHCLAVNSDGSLWAWGDNADGELGLGTTASFSSPVQVGSLTDWAVVKALQGSSFALKSDGSLWAWGGGSSGVLGLGDTNDRSSPVQVGSLTDWAKLFAGYSMTYAIKTDGSLWAWGLNNYGQLGLGDTTNRSSPVQVGSRTDWVAAAGGPIQSFFISSDGALWSCGYNPYGELGLGDTNDRSSPTQVGSSTDWASVSSGNNCGYAIKTDGTLWAWGTNSHGQLGLGNTTKYSSPIQVGTATDWALVSAGGSDSVTVIKTDGTIWVCGNNTYGQLGLGDTSDRSSLVQVGSLTNWTAISRSTDAAYALSQEASAISLLDGKVSIKDSVSKTFDGKAFITDGNINKLDGKAYVGVLGSNKIDGKVDVKSSSITEFNGKANVVGYCIDKLDGKVAILINQGVDLFSGKVNLKGSTSKLFNGKITIGLNDTSLLDGRLDLRKLSTNFFDGKAVVHFASGITLLDGKLSIQDLHFGLFDGKCVVSSPVYVNANFPILSTRLRIGKRIIVNTPYPSLYSTARNPYIGTVNGYINPFLGILRTGTGIESKIDLYECSIYADTTNISKLDGHLPGIISLSNGGNEDVADVLGFISGINASFSGIIGNVGNVYGRIPYLLQVIEASPGIVTSIIGEASTIGATIKASRSGDTIIISEIPCMKWHSLVDNGMQCVILKYHRGI